MKGVIYDKIIERFCFNDFYFEDIRAETANGLFKSVKHNFDLIVFNSKKIIFFVSVENCVSSSEVVLKMRAALNNLVNKLSLSFNDFIVCGTNDKSFFLLNKYNDKLTAFNISCLDEADKIVEQIEDELSYSFEAFNYNLLKDLSATLILSPYVKSFAKTKEKIKTDASGKVFINKHGVWREASDLNTETLFLLTVFGGMFGFHLFYQKKRMKGILYLLTFGFCGTAWFFDCLEILLGIYKDAEGKYLVPLENKTAGIITFLFGIVFCAVVGLLCVLLFKFILVIFYL